MAYSKEVVKEFSLLRSHLTPDTRGKKLEDVPSIVGDIGGLQDGGHLIELLNRFQDFQKSWFEHHYGNHALVDGHVLRVALRIVPKEDYPFYFQGTRSVARRRSYQRYPAEIRAGHEKALEFLMEHGPLTPAEFSARFSLAYPEIEEQPKGLLYDLYNLGKVGRSGRIKARPLFDCLDRLPYNLKLEEISELEARKWLLLKCLSVFGPFSASDIAHWVGWTITETREITDLLRKEKQIADVVVDGQPEAHYIRIKDSDLLHSLKESLPERSTIRLLFNDDNLLLGYLPKIKSFYGYPWKYPQFSKRVIWRGAILKGRDILGEAVVSITAGDPVLRVNKLIVRKEITTAQDLENIEEEFNRHAEFQGKALKMSKAQEATGETVSGFLYPRGLPPIRLARQPSGRKETYLSDSEYENYFPELSGLRDRIARDLPIPPHAEILDLATGYGYFAVQLARLDPGIRVAGVDLSERDVREARKLVMKQELMDRVRVLQMDVAALAFPSESFDLVVNFLGLEDIHMTKGKEGIERAFREAARVLKPQGTFCFTAMPPEEMETEAQKIEVELFSFLCRAIWLPISEYQKMLEGAGFSIIRQGGREMKAYYTGKKLTASQAEREIRFACESVPRIYGKETLSFDEVWKKFGSRIAEHGMGHYSKLIGFIAAKTPSFKTSQGFP